MKSRAVQYTLFADQRGTVLYSFRREIVTLFYVFTSIVFYSRFCRSTLAVSSQATLLGAVPSVPSWGCTPAFEIVAIYLNTDGHLLLHLYPTIIHSLLPYIRDV